MENEGRIRLLEVPYVDRQIISIVEDRDLPEIAFTPEKEKEGLLRKFLDEVTESVYSTFFASTIELADALISLRRKLAKRGNLFKVVGKSDVVGLEFPPGHPRLGGVYVAHPTRTGTYFPVSDFHRLNFENKVNEAIQLLMALGASEINVSHVRGWGRDFSTSLFTEVTDASISASTGVKNAATASVLFSANLVGSESAFLPPNLAWYNYEPTWQSVANGRIYHGLKNFSLTISYNDDFGVNSDLKAQILKSGLNLSGSFTEHANTTWTMSGVFGGESRHA
jgi:hypothetical protein